MMTINRVPRNRQRGVAAIEATVTLPLLFLIFFAVGELGRVMYQYNQLNSLVRESCRYVASQVYTDSNGSSTLQVGADTEAAAKSLAVFGTTGSSTPQLKGLTGDDISIVISGTDLVTVTATYRWTPIFGANELSGDYGQRLDYGFDLIATTSMRAIP